MQEKGNQMAQAISTFGFSKIQIIVCEITPIPATQAEIRPSQGYKSALQAFELFCHYWLTLNNLSPHGEAG